MVGPLEKRKGKLVYSRGRIGGRKKPYFSEYSKLRDKRYHSKRKDLGRGRKAKRWWKPGAIGKAGDKYRHTRD